MNSFQKKIKKFSVDRDWEKFYNPKDLLLGIIEEIGEIRNLIKWEQDPKKLKLVLARNKKELEDDIGDIYWFLALLANENDIDLDNAIKRVLFRNQRRFPTRRVKSRHTNPHLGGKDKNYN